ncbi:MAG TPA: xanthine dehydrogenase family protein molybdopterin-binding subunit [Clostridiaceae bacterium]|nr:xanthine dehydrogenase family protein molybdopterin-binding subunit [Clostridiaceae bacterium]
MSTNENRTTNYIGKTPIRVDAYDKATGKGLFASDYYKYIPDLLHVKILRSPVAHCKITKLDLSKAEAMPGVERIFTAERSPFHMERLPESVRFPIDGECIWAGQPIAIVAAETLELAEDAIEAIELEYEQLPHILTVHEALDPNPKSVIDPFSGRGDGVIDASNPWAGIGRLEEVESKFSGPGTSPNIVGNYVLDKGDVNKAFEEADVIVEREFCTGRRYHTHLEMATAICTYNTDDSITMYGSGCGIHGVIKAAIVNIFDMPETKVRTIQPYIGGSFGGRLTPYAEILCALITLYLKKNCAYQYTREEQFTGAPSAWPVLSRVKFGATKDGRVIAQDYDCIEEIGAIQNNVSYTGRLSSSGAVCVYDIDNIHMDTAATVTNTMPVGPFRGLGCPESEFGMEAMMNELADELGMSPVEVRAKNFIKKGGYSGYGELVTSIGVEKCLRACADAIDLETPSVQDGSVWKKGKGCAVGGKQNTPLGRAEAVVRYYSDASVEVLISCDENGMGASTVMAQIAATVLELPIENIKVIKGDSLVTPYDNYSASSRTTYTTGNAVMIAAEQVKDKLQEEVARSVGVHKSKVSIHGTVAKILGSDIQEVVISTLFENISPYGQGNWGLMRFSPVEGHGVFCPAPIRSWGKDGLTKRMWNWYQYAACAVEVAVNEETGEVKLVQAACSADTGNPINPKMVEGQIEGGSIMASSFVLQEEVIYDENGAIVNSSMSDYRIADTLFVPKNENFHSLINPDPLPDGPFGAKGMAESVMIPFPPAIAQGIYQAVGVRPTYFPMTAEYILSLIKEKKAKEMNEK